MRSQALFARFALMLAILPTVSCGQALLTAPDGTTLSINVNPPFIAANGDTATVSVLLLEPAGTPVPDGTVVQFFTTLGKIQEQAKTNDGVARVNLISDTRSGTAKVTAFSGPATTTADITIGAIRPSRIVSIPIDARIDLSTGKNTARFRVRVLDVNGNPVVGIPVQFVVVDSAATDTILDPMGFTDNSGDAESRVQTKRESAGTIRVRADVLSGTALSLEILIPVIE